MQKNQTGNNVFLCTHNKPFGFRKRVGHVKGECSLFVFKAPVRAHKFSGVGQEKRQFSEFKIR
jgi:hypothetical protein